MVERLSKVNFSIAGMHCASCVYNIETALRRKPGVKEASVNLINEKATIAFDPSQIKEQQLIDTIASAGYRIKSDAVSTHKHKLKNIRDKAVISLLFGVLILFSRLPSIVQLVMATTVQFWAGGQFYQAGFKGLPKRSANMDTLVALGTSAAYSYSVFALFFSKMTTFFDVSVLIIAFILLGRFLEANAKARTSTAIQKLISLQPKEATVLVNQNDERNKITH